MNIEGIYEDMAACVTDIVDANRSNKVGEAHKEAETLTLTTKFKLFAETMIEHRSTPKEINDGAWQIADIMLEDDDKSLTFEQALAKAGAIKSGAYPDVRSDLLPKYGIEKCPDSGVHFGREEIAIALDIQPESRTFKKNI